jgi:hypothetical protein
MKTFALSLAAIGAAIGTALGVLACPAVAQTSGAATFSNSSNCRTAELGSGERPHAALATPTAELPRGTAGGRRTADDAAAALPGTSSLADGSVVVTDSNGGCIIYRAPAR